MKNGGTKMEHLERIEKQSKRELIPKFEIPYEGTHLWDWFWELSGRRHASFGIALIPFSEIKSWLFISRKEVYPWELEVLLSMDLAYVTEKSTQSKQEGDTK